MSLNEWCLNSSFKQLGLPLDVFPINTLHLPLSLLGNMASTQASLLALFVFLHSSILAIAGNFSPTDNIALACGFSGSSSAPNGRLWVGDTGSGTPQLTGKSVKSRPPRKAVDSSGPPYVAARISRHEFSYSFSVKPGPKFIRLHFYPAPYFKNSIDFFTVTAGAYTLLANFSASLAAQASGKRYFTKEFSINVEENQVLNVIFSPLPRTSASDESYYAFINGIEVVSMPTTLYHTREGHQGAHVVGRGYSFFIDRETALETVARINVGGNSISPAEDSGMFRSWSVDVEFLSENGVTSTTTTFVVKFLSTLTHTAPVKLYQTARSTTPKDNMDKINDLTFEVAVDLGFRYLVRLHFCETNGTRQRLFEIFIHNHNAEADANLTKWGGGHGVAIYRDYVVLMEGDRMKSRRNLVIVLRPKLGRSEAFLNGLEIFKLSNPDNNLVGANALNQVRGLPPKKKTSRNLCKNWISTVVTIVIVVLNIVVYHLRRISEAQSGYKRMRVSEYEQVCRQFSFEEMQLATSNFSPEFVVGSGGYGKVYKGQIHHHGAAVIVAIKRLRSESNQGANEFWTEIKMLSKLRYNHLVSLIGYCNEGDEMLLVYEYMERGTLGDHLYKTDRNPPLSWEKRLEICIGAARGLLFLHTSENMVIHRDVKSSNILLDMNWEAKISDFGLSKMGPTSESCSHVSTLVKGTFGYLDPEYFLTRRLTKKSDVYAFGVVLFEVLCGRPAVDTRPENEEEHSLAVWAKQCVKKGRVDEIIDPCLVGKITLACLKVFIGIAVKCLRKLPKERPFMDDVIKSLEFALALQQNMGSLVEEEAEEEEEQEQDVINLSPPSEHEIKEDTKLKSKSKKKGNNGSILGQSKRWWQMARSPPKMSKAPPHLPPRPPPRPKTPESSLYDHLYDPSKDYLPWNRRLQICIDAARALNHIHSVANPTNLHSNLKSTNILLDENWGVKVSELRLSHGLSYLDSDYVRDKLSEEKSYVYSFGLLLFEVLCARKGSRRWVEEDQVSLARWVKSCLRQTAVPDFVDPALIGEISPACLKMFMETAGRCLADHGADRPSMSDMVSILECALKLQESSESRRYA